MGWIYLTESRPSASVPALEGSKSDLAVGSGLLPTANATITPKAFCSPVSETDYYPTHRFGTTFSRSEGTCSRELEPSTAAHPARISASQELERDWEASEAALCLSSSASLASADHSSSSWRTYQDSFFEGLTKFSWDSMRWGMTVAGRLYQPKRWEPHFSDSGCSLWPRPLATDASKGGPNANNWGTPKMSALAARWARPTARDWKGQSSPKKHGQHSPSIDIQAQMSGHPGYLSPRFHVAIMGFDADWTELDAAVMQWWRSKRKRRSCASRGSSKVTP